MVAEAQFLARSKRPQAEWQKVTYKPRDSKATSYLMSRVRATDTKIEIKLRSALHRTGFRFRKNVRALPGKPDIVFAREKVAIFVDGDFWHARVYREEGASGLRASLKTANWAFWFEKLQGNAKRDEKVDSELEVLGFTVLRFWETDLKRNLDVAVERIAAVVQGRR